MAGTKVNNYAIGDSDIEAVMLTTDQIYKGQCQVSLTEMSTTTVPKIAAGSWIENNGTLFKFDSDETLTGSPSDGVVYIRIVPSTSTCTAEMTNTAPTWSDSKQGWYGTSGAANYRYIPIWLIKSSSVYYKYTEIHKNRFCNYICGRVGISSGSSSSMPFSHYENSAFTDIIDPLSEISGTTFTASIGGIYEIFWSISLVISCNNNATLINGTNLYKNGTTYNSSEDTKCQNYGTVLTAQHSYKTQLYLAVNDTLAIRQIFSAGAESGTSGYGSVGGIFFIKMI